MFHRQYWEFSDTSAAPVAPPGLGGYPTWQASVIAPSLFGMIGAYIDTWMVRLKWWWGFAPRVHRLNEEKRVVLVHALGLLEDPAYARARVAVRETSKILGFNKPSAWGELKGVLKDSPGTSENVMRHLEALRRMRGMEGSTLTNPQANLMTELAYVGFAKFPRRP